MSTKIHHGFRFRQRSLAGVHEALMGLRAELGAAQREATFSWIAREAARRLDRKALGEEGDGTSPVHAALLSLWERQRKVRETGLRDPEVDWDASLAILPFRGRVYGIAYIESPAIRKPLFAMDWVEDYAWWDNSDPDEGVPRREWESRGRTWHALLSQDPLGRPSGCGFGFDMPCQPEVPGRDDVTGRLPPFEERVRVHAEAAALGARAGRSAGGTKASWPELMAAIRWLGTDEGKAAVEAEAERIARLLDPSPSASDLHDAGANGILPETPESGILFRG